MSAIPKRACTYACLICYPIVGFRSSSNQSLHQLLADVHARILGNFAIGLGEKMSAIARANQAIASLRSKQS